MEEELLRMTSTTVPAKHTHSDAQASICWGGGGNLYDQGHPETVFPCCDEHGVSAFGGVMPVC